MVANLLPTGDKIVILRIPGRLVKPMLENAVSAYPKLDGRFATFSGLKYAFDATRSPGDRVHSIVDSEGRPFNFNREYNIALKYFISLGRDGYTCFQDPEVRYIRDVYGAPFVVDAVLESLRKFGPEFGKDQLNSLSAEYIERRQRRIELLHASENNVTKDGYIKIAPRIEGRIIKAPHPEKP